MKLQNNILTIFLTSILFSCGPAIKELQGEQGEQGEQGVQGNQGEQGENGERGIRGIRGKAGSDATLCKTLCSREGNYHYIIISCETTVTRSRVNSCEEL